MLWSEKLSELLQGRKARLTDVRLIAGFDGVNSS